MSDLTNDKVCFMFNLIILVYDKQKIDGSQVASRRAFCILRCMIRDGLCLALGYN